MNSEKILTDMKKALIEVLGNEQLANQYVDMHIAFIKSTRQYVDNQVGIARSANKRSNDNQKEINQFLLNRNTEIRQLRQEFAKQLATQEEFFLNRINTLWGTITTLKAKINSLKLPFWKRWWNKIKCMNKK